MIKIPYGESDFKTLIAGKYFYQDRTHFIERLENWNSKYPVFLRPRRFGKSLFISTLHHYYGLEYKDEFQNLFGNLYIGKQPRVNWMNTCPVNVLPARMCADFMPFFWGGSVPMERMGKIGCEGGGVMDFLKKVDRRPYRRRTLIPYASCGF
jgi:hypothetical protein